MLQEFLLTWVPWAYNKLYDGGVFAKRVISAALTEAMNGSTWLFQEGVPIPIPGHLFDASQIANLRWNASTNPLIFQAPNSNQAPRHLSLLSFVVNIPGEEPLDLTNWINDVKWSGPEEPTSSDIFLLWCCQTGKPYFGKLSVATVTFLNEMGDEKTEDLKANIQHLCNGFHLHREVQTPPADTGHDDTQRFVDAVFSSSGC